jgi:peptidoglycan/LPS O-acetylase OafA/YrhL
MVPVADAMETSPSMAPQVRTTPVAATRLEWIDVVKGIAILWIAFFHFFKSYGEGRFPIPWRPDYFATFLHRCAPSSLAATLDCLAHATFVALAMLGYHAVGVFIVMSGFVLTYSIARTGNPEYGWRGWYRSRVLRLYPMYWAAHLIYLISPFEARFDPIDYRFILSFLGDRIYPVDIIMYLNPAWWYFGLILELYLIFPLLFRLLQKVGAGWFLLFCAAETIAVRYILLFNIIQTSGLVLTAFCGSRLWEFAFGMVVGLWYRQNQAWVERRLFGAGALAAGVAIYGVGLYCYHSTFTYIFADATLGTGMFLMLAQVAWYSRRLARVEATLAYVGAFSYGLYLIHEPYATYFGERMRAMPMSEFVVLVAAMIVVLTIASSYLEKAVNNLANRLLGGPKPRAMTQPA